MRTMVLSWLLYAYTTSCDFLKAAEVPLFLIFSINQELNICTPFSILAREMVLNISFSRRPEISA